MFFHFIYFFTFAASFSLSFFHIFPPLLIPRLYSPSSALLSRIFALLSRIFALLCLCTIQYFTFPLTFIPPLNLPGSIQPLPLSSPGSLLSSPGSLLSSPGSLLSSAFARYNTSLFRSRLFLLSTFPALFNLFRSPLPDLYSPLPLSPISSAPPHFPSLPIV